MLNHSNLEQEWRSWSRLVSLIVFMCPLSPLHTILLLNCLLAFSWPPQTFFNVMLCYYVLVYLMGRMHISRHCSECMVSKEAICLMHSPEY